MKALSGTLGWHCSARSEALHLMKISGLKWASKWIIKEGESVF